MKKTEPPLTIRTSSEFEACGCANHVDGLMPVGPQHTPGIRHPIDQPWAQRLKAPNSDAVRLILQVKERASQFSHRLCCGANEVVDSGPMHSLKLNAVASLQSH